MSSIQFALLAPDMGAPRAYQAEVSLLKSTPAPQAPVLIAYATTKLAIECVKTSVFSTEPPAPLVLMGSEVGEMGRAVSLSLSLSLSLSFPPPPLQPTPQTHPLTTPEGALSKSQ